MIRHKALAIAELFNLPDYTYPIFCIALGRPAQNHPVKPRLASETIVFQEEYVEQGVEVIKPTTKFRQTMQVPVRQKPGRSVWLPSLVSQSDLKRGLY